MKKGGVEMVKFLIGAVLAVFVVLLFLGLFSPLGKLLGSKEGAAAESNFENLADKIDFLLERKEDFAHTETILSLPEFTIVGFDTEWEGDQAKVFSCPESDVAFDIKKPDQCGRGACLCLFSAIHNPEIESCRDFKENVIFVGPSYPLNRGGVKVPVPEEAYREFTATRGDGYEFMVLGGSSFCRGDFGTLAYLDKKTINDKNYVFLSDSEFGRKRLSKINGEHKLIYLTLDFKAAESFEIVVEDFSSKFNTKWKIENKKKLVLGIQLDSIMQCDSPKPFDKNQIIDTGQLCTGESGMEFDVAGPDDEYFLVKYKNGDYGIYEDSHYGSVVDIDGNTGKFFSWTGTNYKNSLERNLIRAGIDPEYAIIDICHLEDMIKKNYDIGRKKPEEDSYTPDEVWIYDGNKPARTKAECG